MDIIEFNNEKKYINDFLSLPKKLYKKEYNIEDKNDVKKLLLGTHRLNKYFKLLKYLVYKDKEVVGRFCLTLYPDDDTLYLGFFECINDNSVAKKIFDYAYSKAKELKKDKLVGPVDGSFWNKYRLKINKFDSLPYTTEPYNKEYYYDMFLDNGYNVIKCYVSNKYNEIKEDYNNSKFVQHYNSFLEKGYRIESLNKNEYDEKIKELYYLLTELYSDFPVYKNIELEDFCSIFSSYKQVLNENMVHLAYYDNKLVGFLICVPNYHNLVYHTSNIFNILKILKIRKNPKEYVAPYLGVDKKHQGLGKAISWSIAEELKKNKATCISALIKEENINSKYAEDIIDDVYKYVLLERKVK